MEGGGGWRKAAEGGRRWRMVAESGRGWQKGLMKIARKVWRKITPDYLKGLYESMPRRMQAVIDVQGGHTKY